MTLLDESRHISRQLVMRALEERVIAVQERLKSHHKRSTKYPNYLTEREVAVLQLIAAGKTNREISAQLCISLRTVATHVTHIF